VRLRRIALRNFRRYQDAAFEFPDGVTAILGPNGSGKSTLLEAVSFALYGTDALRTGKLLLRSETAPPADSVSVHLDLELGGQALQVARELRGRSLQPLASLVVDGVVLVPPGAGSSDAVTREVERRLGMDHATFHTTVVARQGELARLGSGSAAERKRLILGLLGIDRIDQAIDAARQNRRAAEAALAAVRQLLGDPRRLEDEAREAAQAREAAEAEAQAREAVRKAAREALEAAQAAAAEAEAAGQLVARLRQELQAARAVADGRAAEAARSARELDAARQAAAEAEAVAPLAALLPQRRAEVESARQAHLDEARRQDAVAAAARLAQERQRVQARLDALTLPEDPEPALARARLDADAAATALADGRAAAKALEQEARATAARLEHLERLGEHAPCPTCDRPLGTQWDDLVGRLRAEARAAQERQAAAVAALRQQEARQTEARAALAELERQQAARQEALRQRALLEGELARLAPVAAEPPPAAPLPDLAAAQERLEGALQAAARLPSLLAAAARLPGLETAVLHAEAELAAAREEAARLAGDPRAAMVDPAPAARARLADAQAAERSAALAAQAARHAAMERARQEQEALRRLAEDRERRGQERELARQATVWGALSGRAGAGLLERFRDHLVARAAPAVAAEASRLLALFTGGRYAYVVLDEGFEVSVGDGGPAFPLERFSGGEQDLVHLALRLAVSRLLAERAGGTELRFLALDEVFGSLDRERRDRVVEALHGLGALYSQVLVISHLESLQEALGQAVAVAESPRGACLTQNA
jgi:DNA repair protein SbcC/Rad50